MKQRGMALPGAAQMVADNEAEIAKRLTAETGRMDDLARAIVEVAEFSKDILAGLQALAGHAHENAEVAQDHAHETAHFATLAINTDAINAAALVAGEYALPYGFTEEMVRKVIASLEADLRRAAGESGGVKVSLTVKRG